MAQPIAFPTPTSACTNCSAPLKQAICHNGPNSGRAFEACSAPQASRPPGNHTFRFLDNLPSKKPYTPSQPTGAVGGGFVPASSLPTGQPDFSILTTLLGEVQELRREMQMDRELRLAGNSDHMH